MERLMIRSRAFLFLLLFLSGEANAADLQIKEIKYDCKAYNEDRFTLKIRSDGKVTYIGKTPCRCLGLANLPHLAGGIQKSGHENSEDRLFWHGGPLRKLSTG